MNNLQFSYLRSAVNIAVNNRDSGCVSAYLHYLRSYKHPVYGYIRDIVGDPRFYGVLENEPFYRRYAVEKVRVFIDGLSKETWKDEFRLVEEREQFLSSWFFRLAIPFTEEEKEQITKELDSTTNPIRVVAKFQPDKEWNFTSKEKKSKEKSDYFSNYVISDCTEQSNVDHDNDIFPPEADVLFSMLEIDALNEKLREESDEMNVNPSLSGEIHLAEAAYLNRIDPTLLKLAKMIGRSGDSVSHSLQGKFQHSRSSDITGVTIGRDLNSLLPTEIAILANRETENIFFQRYAQSRLQIFSSGSQSFCKSKRREGAIFMCVDTSSSMYGEPEKTAKSLALAIAIIAQRRHRPLVIINYSYEISYFILTDLNHQRRQLRAFLTNSYGGGNNEELLFRFLFTKLPQLPRFRSLSKQFEGGDLLIVSDFAWGGVSADVESLLEDARAGGMKFYSLGIDCRGTLSNLLTPNNDWPDFGSQFFINSDHSVIFSKGKCKECKTDNSNKKDQNHDAKDATSRRNRVCTGFGRSRHDHR